MIKVLHIIDTGGPGGAETVFLNIATGMSRERFEPTCVVSRDDWLTGELRARNVEPLVINAKGSLNFGYLQQLRSIVRSRNIDVIAAHLYGSAVYGSLAGLACGVPVVSILHGHTDIADQGRFAGVKRFLVRRGSTRFVFVSEQLQAAIAPRLGAPAQRCSVIPNGVDLSRYAPGRDDSIRRQLGLDANTVLIGAVGNVRKPKGYDVLLRAAAELQRTALPFHLVIAGEAHGSLYSELMQQRASLGLDGHVTFLGLRQDVARVLHNLDLYVLSSTTEGFSIACIEAMACAIPVVATRSGGPELIIESEKSGLLVPVNDPLALSSALLRVARDPELARQLTGAATQRVHERFSLARMLDVYENLFAGIALAR